MLISEHLTTILDLVREHPIVSVEAATGTGKSVGIPAAIAAWGSRCFVTVPTRTAAVSLAEYQRSLQQSVNDSADVTKLVGYAAEGDIQYTNETLIAYVTGGHARRKILSYFNNGAIKPTGIDFCDVLMVDEVHSGSLDNTVVISLWLHALNAGVRVPRLVIASATPIPLNITPKPYHYSVQISSFPIVDQYTTQDYDIEDPAGPLYMTAAQRAFQIHNETPIDSGHILIFAPGSAEVESIAANLEELLKTPTPGKTVLVIPAFSALKREDINRIYKPTSPTERKIVIATNIAEMSITISDIGHVIDTMAERRAETSKSGGFRLVTHYISKDSAQQRRGRTGRTRPGVCYRLCTQKKYAELEQHRPSEIERIPIYETVIELLDVGLIPEQVLIGVDPNRIIEAVNMLTKLGMTSLVDGRRQVNESGHFAPNFPLSVRNASFLWKWLSYKGLRFSQKVINEAGAQGLDFNFFEIDPSSEYSSLRPSQMPSVTAIYQTLNYQPRTIIDATANVGGDTVHFARMYPDAEITSIEIDPNVATILRRNIENIPQILQSPRKNNVRAVNMSAVGYFSTPRYADMIFFDPPWGGWDYKDQGSINLMLDNTPIGVLIGNILSQGMTPMVSLKLPVNADINRILADISERIAVTPTAYNVTDSDDKVAYLLMFIQPTSSVTPITNVDPTPLPEVPLKSAALPVFPGIVVASIIDSYGPSYFWIPRKRPGQSSEEYALVVKQYKAKHFAKYLGYSDLETALKLWDDLIVNLRTIHASPRQILRWAQTNSINNKKIRELLKVVDQSIKSATRLGYSVQIGRFNPTNVINASRPFLLSTYSDLTFIHSRHTTYYNPASKESARLDIRETVNQFETNPPLGVIGLVTAEIKTKSGTIGRIGFAVDTDKDGYGRPIRKREESDTRRGPRVITHAKTQPFNVSDTLQLISTLGLSQSTGNLDQILGPWIRNEDNAVVPYNSVSSYSATVITQMFKQYRVEFPLRRRYRSVQEAETAFINLFSYNPNWQQSPYMYADAKSLKVPLRMTFQSPGTDFNTYLWLPNEETLYQTIDWVPDYFIESSRMHCMRKSAAIKMSPHDAWYSYGSYVETAINKVLSQRQDLSLANVREALYLDKRVPECTHEKVTFLSSLIKLLNIDTPRIFDGSAGWGDRMIAAMTVGANYYVGIDPNTNSQPGFNQMVDIFGRMILPNESPETIHHRFGVLPLSMPDAVLPVDAEEGTFDIAFLSPPSFDSELYSSDTGQSIQLWRDERAWYMNFLFQTLDRCWNMVRPNGFLVIQSILIATIAPYLEFRFPDAFFCGPIAVEVSNRKKPLWIWAKFDPSLLTPSQQEESRNLKQASSDYITTAFPELIGGTPPTIEQPLQQAFDILKSIPLPSAPTLPSAPILPSDTQTQAAFNLLSQLNFETELSPTLPVVTPTLPVITPTLPVITPTLPVITPSLPVSPTLPVITPSFPVSPTLPVITPSFPVSPNLPVVTPSFPVSPTLPVVTPTLPLTPGVSSVSTGTNVQAALDLMSQLNFD